MAPFDSLKPMVSSEIIESFQIVWNNLGKPGSWWSGRQRIEIAKEMRDSCPPSIAERIVDFSNYSNEATDGITPFVKAVARKIAYESSSIDKNVFDQIVAVIGEDQYAEIAQQEPYVLAAIVAMITGFLLVFLLERSSAKK